MPTEKAKKIADAFQKYVRIDEISDKSIIAVIKGFNRKDIEETMDQYLLNDDLRFYKAMARRSQELKENEARNHEWKKIFVGFILGIAVTLITQWLLRILELNK